MGYLGLLYIGEETRPNFVIGQKLFWPLLLNWNVQIEIRTQRQKQALRQGKGLKDRYNGMKVKKTETEWVSEWVSEWERERERERKRDYYSFWKCLKLINLMGQARLEEKYKLKQTKKGSGCGSVGRAVASDTRFPRFESSHWQNLLNICLLSTVLKRHK